MGTADQRLGASTLEWGALVGMGYWKTRELSMSDGGVIRGKDGGILVITSLQFWLFQPTEADLLIDACTTLAKGRHSHVTIIIDREREERENTWSLLTSGSRELAAQIPDVMVGFSQQGEVDIPVWDGIV